MNLPIYDLIINNDEDNDAEVSFVALVDSPAIKKEFLAFSEQSELIKFAIQSESEHIITGALMIPQQLIYRNSEQFGEHYVKF